jgi:hypothetical protein
LVPEEVGPHIFCAVLVDCQMDSAKGPAANLLLDEVLVDAMLGGPVILAVAILGASIEGFLRQCSAGNGNIRGAQNETNFYMASM